ncbi:MAG: hypothetical protein WC788_07405 [Candidatus Paceibacterota bacterium]
MDQMLGLILAATCFYLTAVIGATLLVDRKNGRKLARKRAGLVALLFASGIYWIISTKLWHIHERYPGELAFVGTLLVVGGIWTGFLVKLTLKDNHW